MRVRMYPALYHDAYLATFHRLPSKEVLHHLKLGGLCMKMTGI